MKNQVAILLAVFLCLLAAIHSQEQGQYYCGRRLASTLAMLCENGLTKRSQSRFGAESYVLTHGGYPWVPVHRARGLDRSKRQVVSECCDNPCTIEELQSYCAN